MKLKSIFAVAVVAAATFASGAQASPIWTLSAEGTIASGTDYAGLFGAVGQDLAGVAFLETIVASVNPADYSTVAKNTSANQLSGTGGEFAASVTINGKTFSYNVTQAISSAQTISDGASTGGAYNDQIYSFNVGNYGGGQVAAVIQAWTNYAQWGFVPTTDFGQKIAVTGPLVNTSSSLNVDKNGVAALYFNAFPSLITVNANEVSADVPEPASIALFGLGALGIGALRRRKAN